MFVVIKARQYTGSVFLHGGEPRLHLVQSALEVLVRGPSAAVAIHTHASGQIARRLRYLSGSACADEAGRRRGDHRAGHVFLLRWLVVGDLG